MSWPKGRPRSASEKAKIAAAMRLTGGRKRKIEYLFRNVALVPLGNGRSAILDAADVPLVEHRSWHQHSAGYAVARTEIHGKQRTIYMHRVILPLPVGLQVDHANGDRLDNRRSNLRPATPALQRANQIARPGSRSQYRGVTAAVGKAHPWAARLGRKSLGAFATEEEAARAVDVELIRVYGEYARLNFPEAGDARV